MVACCFPEGACAGGGLAAGRGPAVDHHRIQHLLRAPPVYKIASLQHLAVVPDHLGDINRIVATVFRSVIVYVAGKALVVG